MCRAHAHALAAEFTLAEVDVREVVLQTDRLEGTFLDAFPAPDTGGGTRFTGDIPLVLVHAAHEDAAVFRSLVPQLDDVSRAGFDASTAGNAFFVGNDGQPVDVHVNGVKGTNADAIAAPEAPVRAIGFSPV